MRSDPRASDTNTESAVRERYSAAARAKEVALCCPVDYDPQYLKLIPQEVLERDYGCGDPSRFVREGDVVLDLGSGAGKICFIAAQIAGPKGAVIGVDLNEEMLRLARASAPQVAEALGYANVEFHRARIQDLALDLDALDSWLVEHPVRGVAELAALEEASEKLRRESTLIADASVDLVVSSCVLNLVRELDRVQLMEEIFRVLKVGGCIAISDIVSDEPVPDDLKADPELWSGCVSGAFQELEFLLALEAAGFRSIALDKWETEPFAVVEGIEFRSITVTARKADVGPGRDANQALLYRGPWKAVEDEWGNRFVRGERTAVSAMAFQTLRDAPYGGEFVEIPPRVSVPEEEQPDFESVRLRDPRETKGAGYRATRKPGQKGCC
ncbi:MAG: methyltransferase domain-containing protein [Myxococcales bacterium]|nr:methyltransferase domain-containing protein [Myxococcales bacterium]